MLDTALILCGGHGSRLRPHTLNTPKPMVLCNEKPFLYFVLCQLAGQGIKKFILTTGYLGSKITEYFGDGSEWGWDIIYSQGDENWMTGRRFWEARRHLPEVFLIAYADNFTEFSLLHSFRAFNNSVDITFLAVPNMFGEYTNRGNIRLLGDDTLVEYDKESTDSAYEFVEIGYLIARRYPLMLALKDKDCDFSVLLRKTSLEKRANAVISNKPYIWITDEKSWKNAEKHLKKMKF